jgi:hypothetical protein
MATECSREQDVLDAVSAGRWARRCDAELRSHVDGCPICQDVAAVFAAISEERDAAEQDGDVPPSSIVWWRAQIRAREEAAAAAARPIAVAQIVAVACLIAAAIALAPLALTAVKVTAASTVSVAAWFAPRAAAVSSAFALVTGMALPILPFAAASILLAPIFLYYMLREE